MAAEFVDRKMICEEPDCRKEYIFTAGEQKFFLQKAFAPPTRCPDCRKKRKKDRRKRRRQLLRSLETREAVDVKIEDDAGAQVVPADETAAPAEEEVASEEGGSEQKPEGEQTPDGDSEERQGTEEEKEEAEEAGGSEEEKGSEAGTEDVEEVEE